MANRFEEVFMDIADAIRKKTNTTDKIKPKNMAKKIGSISTSGGFKSYFNSLPEQGYYFNGQPNSQNLLWLMY